MAISKSRFWFERIVRYKTKISRKKALEKIVDHAIYGTHDVKPRPRTTEEVRQYFSARNMDLDMLAEECRDYKRRIPEFEGAFISGQNISGWQVFASGGMKVASLDQQGQERASLEGSGELIVLPYLARFERACESRDRAVERVSYQDFQDAVVSGIISIDSFLNLAAESWNRKNPNDPFADTSQNKVDIRGKLGVWIPKIAGIPTLDRSGPHWNHFDILKKIRDNEVVHQKETAYGYSHTKLASDVDLFRTGIAEILGGLHIILHAPIPSVIINAVHMPDVEAG